MSTAHDECIRQCELPAGALLEKYRDAGDFTDCYCTELAGHYSHSQFVENFYCTWLFKLERAILTLLLRRGSSDAQARELAINQRQAFAAWTAESRSENQLLMCDLASRTRSWLMSVVLDEGGQNRTRLYFGSAVVHAHDADGGTSAPSPIFRLLLPFHRWYSVALLRSARARLRRLRP